MPDEIRVTHRWAQPRERFDERTLATLATVLDQVAAVQEAWLVGSKTKSGDDSVREGLCVALVLDPSISSSPDAASELMLALESMTRGKNIDVESWAFVSAALADRSIASRGERIYVRREN